MVSTTGQPCFVSLKLSFLCRERSLESVFSILTRPYGLDDPCLQYRQRKRYFSLLPNSQTGCGAHSTSYSIDTREFPGVKTADAWSDHSPPSRACMPSWRGKGQLWLLCAMNEWIGFTVRLRKEAPWVGRSLFPRYEKIAVAERNPNPITHPAVSRHYPPPLNIILWLTTAGHNYTPVLTAYCNTKHQHHFTGTEPAIFDMSL